MNALTITLLLLIIFLNIDIFLSTRRIKKLKKSIKEMEDDIKGIQKKYLGEIQTASYEDGEIHLSIASTQLQWEYLNWMLMFKHRVVMAENDSLVVKFNEKENKNES